MANQNDSFIDEVTEDLRRDRLFLAMRRYGWIAVLAILVLVGAAAWREWSNARAARTAQAFGDALLAAEATQGDAAARAAAVAAVPAPQPSQAALRDLRAANLLAEVVMAVLVPLGFLAGLLGPAGFVVNWLVGPLASLLATARG